MSTIRTQKVTQEDTKTQPVAGLKPSLNIIGYERLKGWSVGKADLLSDHFDSKQSREAVDMPLTCYPFPSFTTFAFW